MKDFAKAQYEWVRSSRQVLFTYCKNISRQDFINQNSSFGRGGSIRNLLVHIATTYQFWIANTALKRNIAYAAYTEYVNIDAVKTLFESIDTLMYSFIEEIEQYKDGIAYPDHGTTSFAPALKLFSHVITHEYHHKGQILSLSRHLGYIPVDTDIMR